MEKTSKNVSIQLLLEARAARDVPQSQSGIHAYITLY